MVSAGFEEGKKAILSMHRHGSGTEKYELAGPSFDANGRLQRLPGGPLWGLVLLVSVLLASVLVSFHRPDSPVETV